MGLQHPHIVQLLEFFEDSDRVYLVMELCSRGELLSLVQQKVAACLDSALEHKWQLGWDCAAMTGAFSEHWAKHD